jgi:hypothetical protein
MSRPGSVPGRRLRPAAVCVLAVVIAGGLAGRPEAASPRSTSAKDGSLSVETDPAGAAVYLDGRFVGQTPLTLPALAAGDHRLRVLKDGFLENSRLVRIETAKTETVRLRLTSRTGPAAVQPGALRIVLIEGEDAVNIIQQKTAVRPIVEVRDRNDLPVAGATVVFTIGGGGGATFAGGASTLTVTTNAAGRAAVTELNPLNNGSFQIRVDASYQGQSASTTINQTNVATPADAARAAQSAGQAGAAGGGGLSNLAIAGIVGGAAAGTVGVLAATGVVGGNGACTFAVTPATVTAGSAAGTATVNVAVSPSNCDPAAWTAAATNAPFVTLSPTSGSGNGSVTLNIAANAGAQRNGTITVANQTITVTQSAACTFSISPASFTVPAAGGAFAVSVSVSPAGCAPAAWTATSGASFITAAPANGTGNGSVTLTVSANTGAQRTGTATIAGQTATVTQSVAAAPCNSQQIAGSDIPETRNIELGRTSGTFTFTYDTASIEDRLVVRYQSAILFDTGCVGTNGPRSQSIIYSGTSSTVTVDVTPNCRVPGSGTAWLFVLSCPQ